MKWTLSQEKKDKWILRPDHRGGDEGMVGKKKKRRVTIVDHESTIDWQVIEDDKSDS